MARPAEPEKRQALAREAVEILRREGMGISMTQLARELGIKRPTLLYHFKDQGELVIAALQDLLLQQTAFILSRMNQHSHPIDRVYARLQAVHQFHKGQEARVVFLSQAIATLGQERVAHIIQIGNQVFEAHRQAQAAAIRQGISDGLVAPCDVDALMALIRSLTDGLVVQRVMTGVAFEPVHQFFWDHVLQPLKREQPS